MTTILVVDDERDLTWALAESLGREGYDVLRGHSGPDALNALEHRWVDLAIIDVIMPMMDGFELCRRIRSNPHWETIPIVFLTAKTELAQKEYGFEAGGDDYITKPFELLEVKLRVAALLRTTQPAASLPLAVGDLVLDPVAHAVMVGGVPVDLTGSEYNILSCLLQHSDEVLSAERLLEEALGYPPGVNSQGTIRWHMMNLRKKLKLNPANPDRLVTVGHAGYVLSEGSTRTLPQ